MEPRTCGTLVTVYVVTNPKVPLGAYVKTYPFLVRLVAVPPVAPDNTGSTKSALLMLAEPELGAPNLVKVSV